MEWFCVKQIKHILVLSIDYRSRNVFLRVTDGRKYCWYSMYAWGATVCMEGLAVFGHFFLESKQARKLFKVGDQETIGNFRCTTSRLRIEDNIFSFASQVGWALRFSLRQSRLLLWPIFFSTSQRCKLSIAWTLMAGFTTNSRKSKCTTKNKSILVFNSTRIAASSCTSWCWS